MFCDHCKNIITLLDDKKWPLYYFGAGPNNPENARVYFCGPECAYKFLKKDKSNEL